MNKVKFVRDILQYRPDLKNIETYFYVSPVDHILSGFLCEITPRGAYVWKFLFPLFDPADELHLLYSERLQYPGGYIDFEAIDKKDLAEVFAKKIESYIDNAYEFLTMERFASYCASHSALLMHEHSQMVYGFSLLLLGDEEKASVILDQARNNLLPKYKSQCSRVLQRLSDDPEGGKRIVLEWEKNAKLRLGIY